MTKHILASALLLSLMILPARGAEFASTDGVVEMKKSGAALWIRAKPKAVIATGDVIRTGSGAKAEVRLDEGHQVSLKEKTTARVESAAKGDSRFFLEVGRLKAKVSKLRAGSKFQVRTPLAVASVRGTVFEVEVGEDHTSSLFVSEGKVFYKELEGLGQEALVPAGESLVFTPPAPPAGGAPEGKPDGKDPSKVRKPAEEEGDPKKVDERKRNARGMRGDDKYRKEKEEEEKLQKEKEEGARSPEKEADGGDKEEDRFASLRGFSGGDSREELKREILRETQLSLEKEFVQDSSAMDQKQEQSESGRTLIDAFGRRVRQEEYVLRPAGNHYAQQFYSRREGRDDQARFDLYARGAFKDLSELNTGTSEKMMDNWVTGTQWFVSNGGSSYREWKDGGGQVMFDTPQGKLFQVVFNDWFVEIGGAEAAEPVLLSHWVPDPSFSAGNMAATFDRDQNDVLGIVNDRVSSGPGDGGQDIPTGYINFDFDGRGIIGDDRAIDGAGFEKRMTYFEDFSIADAYRNSEGYDRVAKALYNDKDVSFSGVDEKSRLEELSLFRDKSFKQTLYSEYLDPVSSKLYTLNVDAYYVTDEGTLYPYGKVGGSLSGFIGINREEVYRHSLDKRDIDIMTGPGSVRPSAGTEAPPSSANIQPAL